jgi:hypothetical protein
MNTSAQGHGGLEWVWNTFPVSALPDYGTIGDIYHEYYWSFLMNM